MKRIIGSSVMLLAVLAMVAGGTGAFFNDTETSTGNVFTAGAIDLKVDHTKASYNDEWCDESCELGQTNLVVNGGFETPVLSNGSYAIYNNGSQTSWNIESGPGLEIQRNAAGASFEGSQLAELDSTGSSAISQVITTVAGQKYQFSFRYSPRPNVPAGDNAIGYEVEVVSGPTTLFSGQVGTTTAGLAGTSWTLYTFEFVAVDNATKIIFRDLGTSNNSYGGYIDDVRVNTLTCTSVYTQTPGGYCELWATKDLEEETFFNFTDVKPEDQGTNLISLHVDSNEAYMCLGIANQEEQENDRNNPELLAGDTTTLPLEGELGEFLMVAGWYSDINGNKIGTGPMFGPIDVSDMGMVAFADSATVQLPVQPGDTEYVQLEWCLGNMTVLGNVVTCDGDVPNINQTQTDAFLADLQFYAVQSRNNDGFLCSSLNQLEIVPENGPAQPE